LKTFITVLIIMLFVPLALAGDEPVYQETIIYTIGNHYPTPTPMPKSTYIYTPTQVIVTHELSLMSDYYIPPVLPAYGCGIIPPMYYESLRNQGWIK